MTSCTAFQITADDVANVLRDYALRVINTNGLSFETMAESLVDELDHARIEAAALNAECDLEAQTVAAYAEIKAALVEAGIIEF